MRYLEAAQMSPQLVALLEGDPSAPITLRDKDRDVAVVVSAQRYQELAEARAREFARLANAVSSRVAAAGVTEQDVEDMLAELKAERVER